jgi:hypothetical protein
MAADAAAAARPTTPILGVNEREDIKAFYHNAAYRAGRAQINIEKMKVRTSATLRKREMVFGPAMVMRRRACGAPDGTANSSPPALGSHTMNCHPAAVDLERAPGRLRADRGGELCGEV